MGEGRRLDDWLEGYIKFTERSEPPTLYKHWVGVSVIASALQRKCWLLWDWYQFPNLYIVLVGPSGRCRKGTAMRPGKKLLSDLGINVAADATTREALIRALKQSVGTSIVDGKPHCSLTVYSPELTVFLGYNNLQLIADLTDWFDCQDEWRYETKTQGIEDIKGVWVNLIGATTPELIQSALPRDAIGGGLTSRIIFVYEDRTSQTVALPFLTDKEMALFGALEEDLAKINMLQGQFKVTEEFCDKYVPWYNAQMEEPPFQRTFLAAYASRRQVHLLKLCMIFSASRGDSMVITEYDFDRAKYLLEATEEKMPKVFGGVGRSDVAALVNMVMEYVEEAKDKQASFVDLMRTFHADADRQDMYKAMGVLEATGKYKVERNPSTQAVFIRKIQ